MYVQIYVYIHLYLRGADALGTANRRSAHALPRSLATGAVGVQLDCGQVACSPVAAELEVNLSQ